MMKLDHLLSLREDASGLVEECFQRASILSEGDPEESYRNGRAAVMLLMQVVHLDRKIKLIERLVAMIQIARIIIPKMVAWGMRARERASAPGGTMARRAADSFEHARKVQRVAA